MSEEKQEKHGEFEREPVPASKTRGLKAFVGMYAGEHCAGTKLMIGPLFVAAGIGRIHVVYDGARHQVNVKPREVVELTGKDFK
jgi:hypothetical protein